MQNQEEIRQRFTSLGGLESENGDEDIFRKAHKTGNSIASMSNISLVGEAEEIIPNENKFSIGSINIKNPVAIKEGNLVNSKNSRTQSDRQQANLSCP